MIPCTLHRNPVAPRRARAARSALLPLVVLLFAACSEDPLRPDAAEDGIEKLAPAPSFSLGHQSGNVGFVSVGAGAEHTCGVMTDGAAYCWGSEAGGRLGSSHLGGVGSVWVPVAVSGDLVFAALSVGPHHSCGVAVDGVSYCWGEGGSGQLGNESTSNSLLPVPVWGGGLVFKAVSAGGHHTCAVTKDSAAYCWGLGFRLGDGSTATALTPVPVSGGLAFTEVSAGGHHTCGVTTDGVAYCWGLGQFGQLGNGSTANSLVPMPVSGGLAFAAVSAGADHTCGVTKDGAMYCWGMGQHGQLGNGSTANSLVPAPVAGGLVYAAVSAGNSHTCSVTTDGAAHCWGSGAAGRLGNGSTANSPVPSPVSGGFAFAAVSAGLLHTCGVTTVGDTYCWGAGLRGRLGTGEPFLSTSTSPVAVAKPLTDKIVLQCTASAGERCEFDDFFVSRLMVPHPDDAETFCISNVNACSLEECTERIMVILGYAAGSCGDRCLINAPQQITFTSAPPAPAILGNTYTVAATGGGSGNPVVFSSLTGETCTVAGTTVSFAARGTCTIAADQEGADGYLAAETALQSFPVWETQVITFVTTPPDPALVGATYTVGVIGGGSANPVELSVLSVAKDKVFPCVFSQETATIRFDAPGTCEIHTKQAGDPDNFFLPADVVSQIFDVVSSAGHTPPGSNVAITPIDQTTGEPAPASITFSNVVESGETTVGSGTVGQDGGPPPPAGFRLGNPPSYFEISTTATFSGPVTICIDYSAVSYGNESVLRLLHHTDGGEWVDVTTSIDIDAKIVCGEVESFSPFLVAELNLAPVVTSIALLAHPLAVGTGVSLTAHFTDANPGDTHTASIDWGPAETVGSVDGIAGTVTANYAYAEAGVYTVHVTVSDGELTGTRSSTLDDPAYVVVYDPSAGFVTGGGWIDSPAGACQLAAACASAAGRANFGFNARYRPGRNVPDGATQFQFKAGDLSFHSQSYEWLVVAGARAQFKGVGRINGGGDYGFLLTAVDGSQAGGGGVDRFRIKIWDRSSDLVVYDNQMGEDDDSPAATAVGGGRIVIHRK